MRFKALLYRKVLQRIFGKLLLLCFCFVLPGCASGKLGDASTAASSVPAEQMIEKSAELKEEQTRLPVSPGTAFEVRGRILTWRDGKQAACSITFDDGTMDQYSLGAPLLDAYGLRGTFFIITGPRDEGVWKDNEKQRSLFSWEQAVLLAEGGHEIGSHSVGHPDLRQLDREGQKETVIAELQDSAEAIRRRISPELLSSEGGLTFCWPYWRTNGNLVKEAEQFYLAARAGEGPFMSSIVRDPYEIHSEMVLSTDSFPGWVRKLQISSQLRGWTVFSFHGFYSAGGNTKASGWQPVSTGKMEALLLHLSENSFWTAPFGEVFRYAVERQAAVLDIEEVSPDGIVIKLEDGLDDSMYSQPLSVEIFPPGDMNIEIIKSARDEEIPFQLLENGWLRFDVRPDGSPIILKSSP